MGALLPPVPPVELPDDLAAFLLAHACISARDEDATRQALRHAAEDLPDRQAHQVAHSLYRWLSPDGRAWLQRMA